MCDLHLEFKSVIPLTGWVVKLVLRKAVNDMLKGAARFAESG